MTDKDQVSREQKEGVMRPEQRINCSIDAEGFARCVDQNEACRFYGPTSIGCYYALRGKCCHAGAINGKIEGDNKHRRKENGGA